MLRSIASCSRPAKILREIRQRREVHAFRSTVRQFSNSSSCKTSTASSRPSQPRKFEIILDNETVYVPKDLATALGWKPETGVEGVRLSLHGWEPSFFTITPEGSDSELLARNTIESAKDPNVTRILDYLKDR